MRRLAIAALTACVFAACFGATLVRTRPSGQKPTEQAEQQAIDQKQVLPLVAVRAPAGLGDKDFGDRAMAHVRALVEFGPRHSGMPGHVQQISYIEKSLQAHGIKVRRDTWTDRKELLTFTNLMVTIPGKQKDRILLGCHHDTKCTQGHADAENNFEFQGANDGASGVALLLELAPLLAASERQATIELVFFDGEESLDWRWNDGARALFGSKRYVKRHRDARLVDPNSEPPIAAMVLVDMVGRTELHLQEELYSTPLLRQIQWSAAVALGHTQHVFRRAEAASDDHKPFLDVGIPAVDLIDLNGNPHWHTKDDTVENMSGKSMQNSADLVLTMLTEVERVYVLKKD